MSIVNNFVNNCALLSKTCHIADFLVTKHQSAQLFFFKLKH